MTSLLGLKLHGCGWGTGDGGWDGHLNINNFDMGVEMVKGWTHMTRYEDLDGSRLSKEPHLNPKPKPPDTDICIPSILEMSDDDR